MSGLQLLDPTVLSRGLADLRGDLDDGTWHRRNAHLLGAETIDVGSRLITATTDVAAFNALPQRFP